MLPEIGDLVFSLVVGYMGALEFLFVVRHLYHWSFRHNPEMRDLKEEAASLQKLQDRLKSSIAEASENETAGFKAMKDGVLYKDGFRIVADQDEIDELQEKVRKREQVTERQREIEAELARQRKIEKETRRQLKEAEDELQRVEEEKERERLNAEKEKEEEETKRQRIEEEENTKRILEAERRKEEDQRLLEEEEEKSRKLIEAERQNEDRERMKEIEEESTRKLLEAEREQAENERKSLEAEKEKEDRQRQLELDEENERKLIEAEREQEERQRQQELDDEAIIRRLLEAERKREQEEEEENSRKLLEAERGHEEAERLREEEAERELVLGQQRLEEEQARQRIEEEENYRRLLQIERDMEERERLAEEERQALIQHTALLEKETAERLLAAEREAEQQKRQIELNEENIRNLLAAERELELKKQEMEEEAENLQRLIEAEKEMEERQRRVDAEALQKFKSAQAEVELRQTYDVDEDNGEELFVKENISRSERSPVQTVKTQFGQTSSDSLKPKTLLFPGVSEESSSAEPPSSKQSSFSTEQSSDTLPSELHFDEIERQAPDGGEDLPSLQYSDEYLRSLDGIKNKPLVREDGSGRRRAFKMRRSSGSSTSSRESRASREEELKMFTSLEEQESENIRKGESEYDTIKYASEPNLKVGKQHRRHKRSPAKDAKRDSSERGSLEMLDEEESNPWGEVKPGEHYKDTAFWKREKNLSIEEELDEADAQQRVQSPNLSAVHIPKMSSFEEATKSQHEEAISVLRRQRSKDPEPRKEDDEENGDTVNVSTLADARLSPAGSNSSPASASASISPALISPEPDRENSQETEDRSPSGSGLRRSPRVDEMRRYKENWKEERRAHADAGENPAIEIDYASDDEPMPVHEEYLLEGISDFYDFNASINPSRSRSRSRSKTPAVNRSVSPHQRRTPSPQNLSQNPDATKSRSPSPDPASYKFIYQRILPSLAAADKQEIYKQDQRDIDGLSDFYDFNSKLNREAIGGAMTNRSHEAHRTSVDYVIDDLDREKLNAGGAIAKQITDLRRSPTTPDYERSISAEWRDVQKLKEELLSGSFKRSTYVGESMDFSDQFESLREEAKVFRRSRSKSRSPGYDVEQMTARILAKKQLQEQILEDITRTSENLDDFSYDITQAYVDRNRRASDTALIQRPQILFQIQDLIQESEENLEELEADEYHHFRRFSLAQEIPTEQYPEEYEEMKVKSMGDLRTWAADEESHKEEPEEDISTGINDVNPPEDVIEEAYESGSDDERQTVVEVEDEIDEDLWDYNERPEESHNEQSECEEADREMDRYADRHADDWRDVEGAVGGVLDEDSFLDEIYDEAIKNRKPSGILRDYDSIVQEIQISDADRLEEEVFLPKDFVSNGNGNHLDRSLWSPRSRSSRASSRESSRSFLENERRDNEHRYLGDATMSAINSTRLRSRYGISPATSYTTNYDDDTTEVDINYVPKKEYNWRKNFKLDDEENGKDKENHVQSLDARKFSLGGESITLFSQSRHNSEEELERVVEASEDNQDQLEEEMEQEPEEIAVEKTPKTKKKSKKKSRKGSKGSTELNGEELDASSRRSSKIVESDLPRKKSRRESKGSVDVASEILKREDEQDEAEQVESMPKKKSKKRRKSKQDTAPAPLEDKPLSPEKAPPNREVEEEPEASVKPETPSKEGISIEHFSEERKARSPLRRSLSNEPTASSGLSLKLESATHNNESAAMETKNPKANTSQNPSEATNSNSSKIEAYDILKDGGLYPLF